MAPFSPHILKPLGALGWVGVPFNGKKNSLNSAKTGLTLPRLDTVVITLLQDFNHYSEP